jgi:hypothetical protein
VSASPPTRSTSAEIAARNRRIAAARARGDSWQTIAGRENVSERQAHRAAAAGLRDGGGGLGDVDAALLVRHVIDVQERALERLGELAEVADNSSAMVGAARGTAVVGAALLESLRTAGLILPAPQSMRVALDARAAAVALLDLASRHGVNEDEYLDALFETWELKPALAMGPVR